MQWRFLSRFVPVTLVALAIPGVLATEAPNSKEAESGWKLATETREVIIYSREHGNSSLKEFKAVGLIEAPAPAVHAVIDDVPNYPNFMPFTVECRVIKRENDALVSYQRISPKLLADRDYTLRVWSKSWPTADGTAYLNKWSQANDLGPPEKKGIVRVKVCDGAWLLEPEGADKTRATYTVYTDSGGTIPAFLANRASQTAISRLFAAVRKQVKDPKYTRPQQADTTRIDKKS